MIRDARVSGPRIDAMHPKVRGEVRRLISVCEGLLGSRAAVRVVDAYRTFEQQQRYYEQGRTRPGRIVTYARAGESLHCYGLAFDFALLYDRDGNGSAETLSWSVVEDFDRDTVADWMEVVGVFKAGGWQWGGDWRGRRRDNPHFEKAFGYTYRQLLAKYRGGDFIEGTSYVNI